MSEKITCPKCKSDQITANKKGFSGKKAVGGALLTGGVGLLAGTLGSNQIKVTCLNCGENWMPKEYALKKEQVAKAKEYAELTSWKKSFYNLYESNDREAATQHLSLNNAFNSRYSNIDDAYKFLKKQDSQVLFTILFFLAIIVLVIYLVVR